MFFSYYIQGLMPKVNAEAAREYLGIVGPAGGIYRFESSTTAADPGSGKIRLNAATWAAATNAYIDTISDGGVDVSAFMALLKANDALIIQDRDDATKYGRFTLSGAPVNNSGWFTLPLTHISSAGAVPNNNEKLAVILFYGA